MKTIIFISLALLAVTVLADETGSVDQRRPKCPKKDGAFPVYHRHWKDCSKFWECSNGTPYLFNCPAGLQFNTDINVCDWPQNVNCDDSSSSSSSSSESDSEESVEKQKKVSSVSGAQAVDDDVEGRRPRCPKKDGAFPVYIRHKRDCSKFWECSNGTPYLFNCPANLQFNTDINVCDWPQNVNCGDSSSSSSSSSEESVEEQKKVSSVSGAQAVDDDVEGRRPRCPKKDGAFPVYIRHHRDCSKFWECSNGTPYLFNCPANLQFNTDINVCDWPQNVNCGDSSSSSSSSESDSEESVEEQKKVSSVSGAQAVDDVEGRRPKCPKKNGAFPVYIRHHRDCSKFWECSNGTPYLFNCPANLQFNPDINVCDWPQNVNCGDSSSSSSSSEESVEKQKKVSSVSGAQAVDDDVEGRRPRCPKKDGAFPVYIRHKRDCSKFWECSNGTPYLFNCPSGLQFNTKINVCDWPDNVGCGNSSSSSSESSSEESVEEQKKA